MTLADDAAGAVNLGRLRPVFVDEGREEERLKPPDPDMVETDERCIECAWPTVCEEDRTCWFEVGRRRREREKR